jgi:hypothetical protein
MGFRTVHISHTNCNCKWKSCCKLEKVEKKSILYLVHQEQ